MNAVQNLFDPARWDWLSKVFDGYPGYAVLAVTVIFAAFLAKRIIKGRLRLARRRLELLALRTLKRIYTDRVKILGLKLYERMKILEVSDIGHKESRGFMQPYFEGGTRRPTRRQVEVNLNIPPLTEAASRFISLVMASLDQEQETELVIFGGSMLAYWSRLEVPILEKWKKKHPLRLKIAMADVTSEAIQRHSKEWSYRAKQFEEDLQWFMDNHRGWDLKVKRRFYNMVPTEFGLLVNRQTLFGETDLHWVQYENQARPVYQGTYRRHDTDTSEGRKEIDRFLQLYRSAKPVDGIGSCAA